MKIRNYKELDEREWLKCRLLSFFDCSYYDDIAHKKETYKNETISLVAEDNGTIVGFIDVELQKKIRDDTCYLDGDLGGNIWNIGVLPEYRNQKIATQLLEKAKHLALQRNICRFEAWTQDDIPSNNWYISRGFNYIEGYLNVFASRKECKENNLITNEIDNIFGVRSFNFESTLDRKSEMIQKYHRVHEVRLYELKFNE